jgi:transposase
MAKRSVDKELFWRSMLAQFDADAVSIRDFCRRHRLREASFHNWRRELRRRDQLLASSPAKPAPLFVPLAVSSSPRRTHAGPGSPVADSASAARPAPPLEVRLPGGRVLRVRPGFDTDAVRQLLAILESTPPAPSRSC